MTSLNDAAAIATIAGGVGTLIAAAVAVPALRAAKDAAGVSKRAHELQAVTATNELWADLATYAEQHEIEFASVTIAAIRRVLGSVGSPVLSAVDTGVQPVLFTARVPFAVGAFLPTGLTDEDFAPVNESDYQRGLRARVLALGYVRSHLDNGDGLDWLDTSTRETIRLDFARIDAAMTEWVNRMNEISEGYATDMFDRQKFIGKRGVALLQQLYAAEPYILWRNSTTPGRWGMRVLGLGIESRNYHWNSYLQQAAIRQRVNPPGFEQQGSYPGFRNALGWIIGPGDLGDTRLGRLRSRRRMRKQIGRGFTMKGKAAQTKTVQSLPRSPDSGLGPGEHTWADLALDPKPLARAVADWNER